MSMRKLECPGCSKQILVSASGRTSAKCPACGCGLEISSGFAQLQGGEPISPVIQPLRQLRIGPQSEKPVVSPLASVPVPPPINSPWQDWLSKTSMAVAAGVGAAVIAVVALMVILWFGDSRVSGPSVVTDPDLSDLPHRQSAQPGGKGPEASKIGRRPRVPVGGPKKPLPSVVSPPPAPPPVEADPIQSALRSVALINCRSGHGSGFMAAPNLLVTNHHVVAEERMADVRVRFPDHPDLGRREFPAAVVVEDPRADLAVLSVACGVSPLVVPASYAHTNGQRVVAIGSPGTGGGTGDTLQNLPTDGRLGSPYRLPSGDERWALSMAVNPGNSGGPVVDAATGQVVAVVVAKFVKTESQGLAVPHGLLVDLLDRAKNASPHDRRQAESLHRQRYCLVHMVRMLALADRSFQKSCSAAMESRDETDVGRLTAFNDFKSMASRILSDDFTVFETVVCSEVDLIAADEECDPAVRAGITKLRKTLEEQAVNLRRSVPLHEIEGFLREFRTSLERSRSLAATIGRSLVIEGFVAAAEEDE